MVGPLMAGCHSLGRRFASRITPSRSWLNRCDSITRRAGAQALVAQRLLGPFAVAERSASTARRPAARRRRLGPWAVVRETVLRWWRSNAPAQSAALAFYTLFSLAPVLVVSVSIAGAVFGEAVTRAEIERQVRALAGDESAEIVRQVLDSAARPELGGLVGVVGALTLLFGATAVFGQLQEALNSVWGVRPRPGRLIRNFLRKRLLSFGLVLVIGFLLMVSLVLSAALAALGAYLQRLLAFPAGLLESLNFALFFAVITLLFMLIYRMVPDAVVAWRDVATGAVVTALLFAVGKELIGLYLGRAGIASAYGVAGSLVLLLLWVYYSAMIVLLGAGFTRVWSRRWRPPGVVPEPGAECLEEAGRADGRAASGGRGRRGEPLPLRRAAEAAAAGGPTRGAPPATRPAPRGPRRGPAARAE
jgi:membrane protein